MLTWAGWTFTIGCQLTTDRTTELTCSCTLYGAFFGHGLCQQLDNVQGWPTSYTRSEERIYRYAFFQNASCTTVNSKCRVHLKTKTTQRLSNLLERNLQVGLEMFQFLFWKSERSMRCIFPRRRTILPLHVAGNQDVRVDQELNVLIVDLFVCFKRKELLSRIS